MELIDIISEGKLDKAAISDLKRELEKIKKLEESFGYMYQPGSGREYSLIFKTKEQIEERIESQIKEAVYTNNYLKEEIDRLKKKIEEAYDKKGDLQRQIYAYNELPWWKRLFKNV